jgi:hypothetical protein
MRKNHPLAQQKLDLDAYCKANHLLVSFSGRAHGLVDEALSQIGRERRILLTVNQFFTAGRVVANSDLVTVLPKHLIASTGMPPIPGLARTAVRTAGRAPGHAVARTRRPQPGAPLAAQEPGSDVGGGAEAVAAKAERWSGWKKSLKAEIRRPCEQAGAQVERVTQRIKLGPLPSQGRRSFKRLLT